MRDARLLVRLLADPALGGGGAGLDLADRARPRRIAGRKPRLAARRAGAAGRGRGPARGGAARRRGGPGPGPVGGGDGAAGAGAARRAGHPAQGHRLCRRRARRRAAAARSAISTSSSRAQRSPTSSAALLAAGWEWVKEDAYDDQYYRRWMHELPPLIHRERDRMIDVHHAILPLTARPKPDMAAMIADRVAAGRRPLHPVAAGHDRPRRRPSVRRRRPRRAGSATCGTSTGCCASSRERDPGFWPALRERAKRHGLLAAVERAVRLAHHLYGTPVNWCQAPISKAAISNGAASPRNRYVPN